MINPKGKDVVTLAAEDRLAIMQLVSEYNWAIDTRDGASYAATFTGGGVFDGGTERLTGPGELSAFVDYMAQSPRAAGLQHWTGNFVFLEADPARATVKSYMMGPKAGEEENRIGVIGYYVDTVVKVDAVWRFEERVWREWEPDNAQAEA